MDESQTSEYSPPSSSDESDSDFDLATGKSLYAPRPGARRSARRKVSSYFEGGGERLGTRRSPSKRRRMHVVKPTPERIVDKIESASSSDESPHQKRHKLRRKRDAGTDAKAGAKTGVKTEDEKVLEKDIVSASIASKKLAEKVQSLRLDVDVFRRKNGMQDVAGLEDQVELIEHHILNPVRFHVATLTALHEIKNSGTEGQPTADVHVEDEKLLDTTGVPKLFIFNGPPGSGKSHTAEAIVSQLACELPKGAMEVYGLSQKDLTGQYVGVAENQISELFKTAKRPPKPEVMVTVVMCEEMDGLTYNPADSDHDAGHYRTVILTLAECLSAANGRRGTMCLVLGTTNRLAKFDSRIRSRASAMVSFPAPTRDTVVQVLKSRVFSLCNAKWPTEAVKITANLLTGELIKVLVDVAGVDLRNIVRIVETAFRGYQDRVDARTWIRHVTESYPEFPRSALPIKKDWDDAMLMCIESTRAIATLTTPQNIS